MKIVYDKFNSEMFQIKMGNVILSNDDLMSDNLDVFEIIKFGENEGYDHLAVKIPTPYKKLFNKFMSKGFFLTDLLAEYIYYFDGRELPDIKHKTIIREYKETDLEELMKIAKGSFDYDRFHADPTLDNGFCDKYYEQWIYNSCHGFADKIFVSEYEGKAVGFTTGRADHSQEYGRLVLSAVSDEYRGLGIYTSMIYEGVKWLEKEGFKGLIVGTQINNVAVQKAWIKLGFTVLDSEYVLHFHY